MIYEGKNEADTKEAVVEIFEHIKEDTKEFYALLKKLKQLENHLRMVKATQAIPKVTEMLGDVAKMIEDDKKLKKRLEELL